MLLHSVNHLTEREREIYDQLVEKLSRRISRLHRLERQTEKLKRLPGEPDADVGEVDQSRKHVVRDLRPEEVIRMFVDSWNEGDFGKEFYCLSRECSKGDRRSTPFQEYVANRRQKWESRDLVGINRKRLCEVSSSELKGNRAIIHCVEEHTTSSEIINLWREYQLIYEEGGWRIIDFNTRRKVNRPLSSKPS